MNTELMIEFLDLTKRYPYIRNRPLKTEREARLVEQFDNFIKDFIKKHTELSKKSSTRKTITALLKEMFPTLPPADIEKLAMYIRKLNYADRQNKKFCEVKEELEKLNKEQIDSLMDPKTSKALYITLYAPERLMFMFLDKEIKYEKNLSFDSILSRAENSIGVNKLCSLLLLYSKTLYEQIKKHDPFTKFNIRPSEYKSPEDFIKSFSDKLEYLLKDEINIEDQNINKLEYKAYKLTKIISKYVNEEIPLIMEIAKIMLQNQI